MDKFKELTFWFNVAWAIIMCGCISFVTISIVLNDYHSFLLAIACSLVSTSIALMEKGIKTLH